MDILTTKALEKAEKGKCVYTPGTFYKFYRVVTVTAYNAVHVDDHELVQCRIFFQSNPSSWCRSLPLFWWDSKRKKKKAGKPLVAFDIF
ncbi:hypothetical protein D7V72_05335 [bacterium D16-36]|nr:hypothetical protein D7V72_05335 [bacterium D16-36]